MAHLVETMAYSGEVPWHGIGKNINPRSSIEKMLVAAGLDWEVALQPLFAQAPDGTYINLPLKRALMRLSDNKVLTVAGDFWHPLQNKEALEFFRDYTESGGASLETAGSLMGGKLIWALASINKGFKVRRRDADFVKGYILLSSPHEVGKRIKVRTTAVRVVCANTLQMAERDAVQYSQTHTTKFNVASARESIQLSQDQIGQMEADINKLAAKKISTFDSLRLLAEFFQPIPEDFEEHVYINDLIDDPSLMKKPLAAVVHSMNNGPGAEPKTMWGVLNGVTHYIDHIAGTKPEARLASSWFGQRGQIKNDVMNKLLEMAS